MMGLGALSLLEPLIAFCALGSFTRSWGVTMMGRVELMEGVQEILFPAQATPFLCPFRDVYSPHSPPPTPAPLLAAINVVVASRVLEGVPQTPAITLPTTPAFL